ncbi:MAG TPA: glycosyltransferase family A protein [Stellaceae bacterium]|nr:glycosyltransferase family A protein [Stellaceae bacterium]
MSLIPFTFGIPLIARAAARDWERIEALFSLTAASLQAQTDRDFRVVIAGHDRPRAALDARFSFLQADWPAEPVRADNRDSGRKKYAINAQVRDGGGGLLMFLDADDWVDARLVATARARIGLRLSGGLIETGFAVDFRTLRAAPLPHPRIFCGGFHRLCGSSTVLRLAPDDPDPLRRDPYQILHEHYRWIEAAQEYGLSLAPLPVSGGYVINTAENHSEIHGPYAAWRRDFARAVGREGAAIDAAFAARFGLSLEDVRAASRQ